MRYRVTHTTSYHYDSEVQHAHHLLHLVPRPTAYQLCLEHAVRIAPVGCRFVDGIDAFGNPLSRIEITQPHRDLSVVSEMLVEVFARPAVSASTTWAWERVRDQCAYVGQEPAREALEAARFRHESPHVRVKRMFADYSDECFAVQRPVLECASLLSGKLHRELQYAPGETTIGTPVTTVLQDKRGVCQDFAHLMIACLRSRGLPARYVSGYLRTIDPADGAGLVGADASHAWVAVWSPPYGWIEFDPTNGCFVGTDHVAVAWGRDFSDVSPMRGVILGGAEHKLAVAVSVEPVDAGYAGGRFELHRDSAANATVVQNESSQSQS